MTNVPVAPGSRAGWGLKPQGNGYALIHSMVAPGSRAGWGLKRGAGRTDPQPVHRRTRLSGRVGIETARRRVPAARPPGRTRLSGRVGIETYRVGGAGRTDPQSHPALGPGGD